MKNLPTNSEKSQKKERKEHRSFGPMDKAKAVLSVWSERRRPAEICRELDIAWMQFSQWQNQALKGMLSALDTKKDQVKYPPISERLSKLLDRRCGAPAPSKLEKRLEKIQLEKRDEAKTA